MKIDRKTDYRPTAKLFIDVANMKILESISSPLLFGLICLILIGCSDSASEHKNRTTSEISTGDLSENIAPINLVENSSIVTIETPNKNYSNPQQQLPPEKQLDEEINLAKVGLVKDVVDGVTILIKTNSGELILRYAGVFLPVEGFSSDQRLYTAEKVAEYNEFLVSGKEVSYVVSKHSENNNDVKFAYVYQNGEMINTTLIETGHALVDRSQDEFEKIDEFIELEEKAKLSQVGIWAIKTDAPEEADLGTRPKFSGGTLPHHSLIKGREVCAFSNTLLPVIKGFSDKTFITPDHGLYHDIIIDISQGDKWFCTEHEALSQGWHKINGK